MFFIMSISRWIVWYDSRSECYLLITCDRLNYRIVLIIFGYVSQYRILIFDITSTKGGVFVSVCWLVWEYNYWKRYFHEVLKKVRPDDNKRFYFAYDVKLDPRIFILSSLYTGRNLCPSYYAIYSSLDFIHCNVTLYNII